MYQRFEDCNNRTIKEFRRATRQFKTVARLLTAAGITPRKIDNSGGSTFYLTFDLAQLRDVRRALGIKRFIRIWSDAVTVDGEDAVQTYLRVESQHNFDCLRVLYVRKLLPTDRCRVVTEQRPGTTYKALVCK